MKPVLEVFVLTGESIDRLYTPEELEQRELDQAAAQAAAQAALDKAEADAQARAAAIAHAKTLGFTDEMIAVMYPNLAG
jgi:hypothetical protein